MGFAKAFDKQDADIAAELALQRKSVAKLTAILDRIRNSEGAINPADAGELAQAAKVLQGRCRRYRNIGLRMDLLEHDMQQLSFIHLLTVETKDKPPPTPWEILKMGTKDFNWQEEEARVLNERKKTM